MQVVDIASDKGVVRLSKAELIIINNALNEVCNGIEVPEFATRLGAEISEVRKLLGEVQALLNHRLFAQPRLP